MNIGISSSDFAHQWSLIFADIDFINSKTAATRLGLAAQLKFFSERGFFIVDAEVIAPKFCSISVFGVCSGRTGRPCLSGL